MGNRFLAEMGQSDIALQKLGRDHWQNQAVGKFHGVLLSQCSRGNLHIDLSE